MPAQPTAEPKPLSIKSHKKPHLFVDFCLKWEYNVLIINTAPIRFSYLIILLVLPIIIIVVCIFMAISFNIDVDNDKMDLASYYHEYMTR